MTARTNPAGEPGRTASRTKPVRVTVDLDPATYTELNRWVGGAAIAVNPDFPRLPLAKAIRAMIHATTASEAVASAVIEQLRQGQDLAGQDAGRRRERHVRVPRADAWQLRAARALTNLLERGAREGLPVLEWTISHTGAQVTGRSCAQPGAARRTALAAWAAALGAASTGLFRSRRRAPWNLLTRWSSSASSSSPSPCHLRLLASSSSSAIIGPPLLDAGIL